MSRKKCKHASSAGAGVLSVYLQVVYVVRNPKDVCISYFHHLHLYNEASEELTLETFVDLFIDGLVTQLPFFPHVLEAWRQRHHPNMLFLFFEDLKKDLRGSVVKVAEFLGKTPTDEQLEKLTNHLHFSNLKKQPVGELGVALEVGLVHRRPEQEVHAEGEDGRLEEPLHARDGPQDERVDGEGVGRNGSVVRAGYSRGWKVTKLFTLCTREER